MRSDELLLELDSNGPTQTRELACVLGRELVKGAGVCLDGELGAGKTVFVQGLAVGLGIDEPKEVRSPTWLLMVEHPGPLPLLHMDAYFAKRGDDFLADGGRAYLAEEGVVAIEWAERLERPPAAEYLRIEIQHRGETERRLRFHGERERWSKILAVLSDYATTQKGAVRQEPAGQEEDPGG